MTIRSITEKARRKWLLMLFLRVIGSELLIMEISLIDTHVVSMIKLSYAFDNNLIIIEELHELSQFFLL